MGMSFGYGHEIRLPAASRDTITVFLAIERREKW